MFLKIGVKHVLKFSIYNYLLFLSLLVVVLSFKQWKKTLWLAISIVLAYMFGMVLVVYGNFIPKLEIIKFLIVFSIFSLALFNFFSIKRVLKSKHKFVFIFAILFGFFNGLGSSSDLLGNLKRNESGLIPMIEVALGLGTAILIAILLLLTMVTLLRKVPKVEKKTWVLAFSIIIFGLSLPLIFSQMFN
ncbi:MAG: HupE/UreJ family protein [Polaribacter sp.]|uniref:HupE/UreJ family protein n=1 Tax=Polaribacter sp. TaxID=1920175 RepID=UPI003BB06D45